MVSVPFRGLLILYPVPQNPCFFRGKKLICGANQNWLSFFALCPTIIPDFAVFMRIGAK